MTKPTITGLPPVLPTQKALWLCSCSRSTLDRSGLRPVGKRGKSLYWSTADLLQWLGVAVESAG